VNTQNVTDNINLTTTLFCSFSQLWPVKVNRHNFLYFLSYFAFTGRNRWLRRRKEWCIWHIKYELWC